MAIKTLDIAWAAGFLEGEGTMGLTGRTYGYPRVSAGQVQKEPLERLQKLFGGKLKLRQPPINARVNTQPFWTWYIDSDTAIAVMMTIYVLMSPKRKAEIEQGVAAWKLQRKIRRWNATHCLEGHELTPENTYLILNGKGKPWRRCRICYSSIGVKYHRKKTITKDIEEQLAELGL